MSNIKIAYKNILETGTVTVTNEAPGFPKYRLYDRQFKKMFKGDSADDHIIHIDQGPEFIMPVDCLVIPAGHNLAGAKLYVGSSQDNTTFDEWPLTVESSEQIYVIYSNPVVARYWRLRMEELTAPPELGELYISKHYEFDATPLYGLRRGQKKNVKRIESPSGVVSYLKQGEPRRLRAYTLNRISKSERAEMEKWDAVWQGTKPFLVVDPLGGVFFAELQNDLIFTEDSNQHFSCDLEFLEVL